MFLILALILGIAELSFIKLKDFQRKIVNILRSEKVHGLMLKLYPEREVISKEREYIKQKVKLFLTILIIGCLACEGALFIVRNNPVVTEDGGILRNDYGKGKKNVTVYAKGENLNKTKLEISVSDRVYEDAEITLYAEKVKDILDKAVLLENESLDHVDSDLDLMSVIEGYPFNISWQSEKPLILKKTGSIDKTRLKNYLKENNEESLVVMLYATISYEDYSEEIDFAVRLYEPVESNEKKLAEAVKESIEEEDKSSRLDKELRLPKKVNGESIEFLTNDWETPAIVAVLTFFCGIVVYVFKDRDLEGEVKKRNEELSEDYPRIVNQYALYYCAGMHPKAIWTEICRDYRKSISKGNARRCAYENMLRCEAKMADGISEISAYREFSRECGSSKYKKFTGLIEQTLTKGKEQVKDELRAQAEEAQTERLQRARIKGEEAGTKLLMPMFMMLLVVLIIVIVPAFTNFKI